MQGWRCRLAANASLVPYVGRIHAGGSRVRNVTGQQGRENQYGRHGHEGQRVEWTHGEELASEPTAKQEGCSQTEKPPARASRMP
jgi:hypothetical protein